MVPAPVLAQAPDASPAVEVPDAGSPDTTFQIGPTPDAGAPAVDVTIADAKPLPAWAPRLSATVKPAMVSVGDPVKVTIKVRHRKGVAVNLPLKLELGKFSELSRDDTAGTGALARPKNKTEKIERVFVVKVAAYELGKLTLPPIEVTALGPGNEMITLTTPALPILVKSVMRNEPNPKLKELEPPVSVFMRTWWLLYLLIGLAAVGLVVTLTLIISRRLRAKREAAKPPPPPIPPHVTALERLAALDTEGHIAHETYKELFLELSEIVREYVGGRWGFDALEMTTREINHALESRFVEAAIRQRLDVFFASSDLVKFARYRPDPAGARQARVEAERLVRETCAPDPQPVPQPAAPPVVAPQAMQVQQAPPAVSPEGSSRVSLSKGTGEGQGQGGQGQGGQGQGQGQGGQGQGQGQGQGS